MSKMEETGEQKNIRMMTRLHGLGKQTYIE